MQTYRAAAASVFGLLWLVSAAVACPENCDCVGVSVNCTGKGLKHVPADIPLGTTILRLNNNNIQNLSDGVFAKLASLKELYLDNNKLQNLSDGAFHNLTSLEKLSLSFNTIQNLPDGAFSNLISLMELFLHGNDIRVLPDGVVSHLVRLTYLGLSNNVIEGLPYGVFLNLTSLQWLDLRNNSIKSLEAGVFSHLVNLKSLTLSYNDIEHLPDGVFSHLTCLEWLWLLNNSIKSLGTGVFSHLASLTRLSLSHNDIEDLPDGLFLNLTSLQRLYLHNCNIKSLDSEAFSHLIRLIHLYLNNNNIEYLPDGVFSHLTSLEWLSLWNNSIKSLGTGVFSQLASLTRLWLSDNAIEYLQDGVFSHLTSLEWLSLWNNSIKSLDSEAFSHLIRLIHLYLNNNNIEELPDGVFSNLRTLTLIDAHGNNIQNLTDNVFSTLTSLRSLDLSDNYLDILPATVFSNLTSLFELNLSGNSLQTLPAGIFSALPPLCDIILRGNPWRCDCSLQAAITTSVRNPNTRDSTCSSPPHMEDVTLMHVTPDRICLKGDCAAGNASHTCVCDVGWTGSYCDKEHNVALGKTATQSSIITGYVGVTGGPEKAVDGNRDRDFWNDDCAATDDNDYQPWWQVDLAGTYTVSRVSILGRVVNDEDLGRVMVRVGPNNNFTQNGQCGETYTVGDIVRTEEVRCDPPMSGRYVSVQLMGATARMDLCEVEVYITESCCSKPLIENGNFEGTYCYQGAVNMSCDVGYRLVGAETLQCTDTLEWDNQLPACEKKRTTFPTALIAGTSAGAVLALGVAAAVFWFFRRRRKKKRRDDFFSGDERRSNIMKMQKMPLVPKRSQFEGLEVDPGRLTFGERLGSGAFGVVYRAVLTRDDETKDVVVKTLKNFAFEDEKANFLEEIRAVVDLGTHKNLLGIVGCTTVVDDCLYLITEYMPYGDLKNFLKKCQETSDESREAIYDFGVMQMYQVARQIAKGMDHIAQSRYVHGDLAARNVLVGEDLEVKIADFGLAEDIYSRGYRRQDRLKKVPWKWMAPERLQDGEAYTTASDVWSFEIVLYEIATLGGDPYPDIPSAELKDRLRAGYRMPKPDICTDSMYDMMTQCWSWEPTGRPSFRKLELRLDKDLEFYGPEYATTRA